MNTCLKLSLLLGLFVLSADAFAANANMPWEGWIDKVVRSVQGPVAKGAGIGAITAAGLGAAMYGGEGFTKKAIQTGFGLSVAFGAAQWGLPLMGFGNGLAY